MAFNTPGEFTQRNITFGERGTKKRRAELAEYAQILQGLRNQGILDVAESHQDFERPEQAARIAGTQAETEGTRLGNIGERFFQGIAEQYGEAAVRKELGLPEEESGGVKSWPLPEGYEGIRTRAGEADAISPDDISLPGLRPKSDISALWPSPSSRFQIGPVPWASNLRKRRKEKEERAARPFGITGVRG